MPTTGRKLALASTFGVANQIVAVLIGFFIMPFMVHILGDRLYGMWSLVAVFVGYYGLLDLGLSSAISRYMSAALGAVDHQECNRVFNTALRLFVALGGIVVVISGIVAALAPVFFKNAEDASTFWKAVLILGVSLAIGFPLRVFVGALNANLRYDITEVLDLGGLLFRTALIVVALLLGFKVVGLAWITLFASLPPLFLYVYFSFKELPFLRINSAYWGMKTAKALFSYSSYSFITQISNVLRFQLDAVVVTAFVGLASVTHYRIAGAMAQYYLGFMLAVMGAFSTVFSRQEGAGDFEAIRKTFLFASKISVCVSSFIAFGLIAWGKPFVARWMGSHYSDAYPCIVALTAGYLFALWQQPSIGLMFGLSKHRFLALLSMGEGIANLVLSILLARSYGIFGVALGTAIPLVFTKLFLQPVYVCRIARIKPGEYLRVMGKTLALVLGSLLIPLLLTIKLAAPSYGALCLTGVLSLACYAIPLSLLVFSSKERETLLRAVWPRRLPATASLVKE